MDIKQQRFESFIDLIEEEIDKNPEQSLDDIRGQIQLAFEQKEITVEQFDMLVDVLGE